MLHERADAREGVRVGFGDFRIVGRGFGEARFVDRVRVVARGISMTDASIRIAGQILAESLRSDAIANNAEGFLADRAVNRPRRRRLVRRAPASKKSG